MEGRVTLWEGERVQEEEEKEEEEGVGRVPPFKEPRRPDTSCHGPRGNMLCQVPKGRGLVCLYANTSPFIKEK